MKRYEVSGFGVMEYEEVASTNSLAIFPPDYWSPCPRRPRKGGSKGL